MSQESIPNRPEQIELDIDGQEKTTDDTSDLPYPELSPNHHLNWPKQEVQAAHEEARELGGPQGELGGLPVKESAEIEEE